MSRFLPVLAVVGTAVGIGNLAWFETRDVAGGVHSASLFVTGPLLVASVGYLVIRYGVLPLSADGADGEMPALAEVRRQPERVTTRVRIGTMWHTNATVTVYDDRLLIDTATRVYVIMDHQLRGAGDPAAGRRRVLAVEHAAPDLPSPVLVGLRPTHPVGAAIVAMAGVRT